MPGYSYRVREVSGKILSGTIEAENENKVVEYLRGQNYFIVEISPRRVSNYKMQVPKFSRKVNAKDLSVFCRQFSTMLNAGVPILSCITILRDQTQNLVMIEALNEVIANLESGKSLADSVRPFPKVFPEVFVNMIQTGETGGILDEIMERLADNYEREHDIGEKVKSAMTYPIAILVIATIAVTFMLTYVLPKFVEMVIQQGGEMPLPTKIVMGASTVLVNYWWVIVSVVVGSVIFFNRLVKTENGRMAVDGMLLRLPVFGILIQRIVIARFCRSLGSMLKSGVPIIEALETTRKAAGNSIVAEGVARAKESILQGMGISQPLMETGVFPPMVTQMIAIGEETGALDSLLAKIAQFYDREVDNIVNRLSTLLEPIMIVGLGAVLGFIIVAMMMPMFQVMTSSM